MPFNPFSPFMPGHDGPQDNKPAIEGLRDTVITFLLDESGSMGDCLKATISGFNEYISALKRDKHGKCNFTFIKFEDGKIETVHENKPVEDIPELTTETYTPGGGTPLHDSIMEAIHRTEKMVAGQNKNVVIAIQTDGQENSSRKYKLQDVQNTVKSRREAGWVFVFMGADIDAYAASQSYGISHEHTVSYNKVASAQNFAVLGAHTNMMRATATNSWGASAAMGYSAGEKDSLGDKYAGSGTIKVTGGAPSSTNKKA